MDTKKYILAGNRAFVLHEMFRLGLDVVSILATKGSYLERNAREHGFKVVSISSKKQLLAEIAETDFDIFISNGCPFILPISNLNPGKRKLFINIHPSFLPDLRGADPVPGALLTGRDSGATCHLMDDGMDTGGILSRILIPYSTDLDTGLLHQLCFMAEVEAFRDAFEQGFCNAFEQPCETGIVKYTFKDADLEIDFTEDACNIVRRIKAFCNRAKGAYFRYKGDVYRVFDAELVNNEYLMSKIEQYCENEVVLNYENMLLVAKRDCYLKLKQITPGIELIEKGAVL